MSRRVPKTPRRSALRCQSGSPPPTWPRRWPAHFLKPTTMNTSSTSVAASGPWQSVSAPPSNWTSTSYDWSRTASSRGRSGRAALEWFWVRQSIGCSWRRIKCSAGWRSSSGPTATGSTSVSRVERHWRGSFTPYAIRRHHRSGPAHRRRRSSRGGAAQTAVRGRAESRRADRHRRAGRRRGLSLSGRQGDRRNRGRPLPEGDPVPARRHHVRSGFPVDLPRWSAQQHPGEVIPVAAGGDSGVGLQPRTRRRGERAMARW